MFTPKAGKVKVEATFDKTVTENNATLDVKYVDENGQVGNLQKITRKGNEGEECTFNITDLNVPDGYELVIATWEKSVAYGNAEKVSVEVKKKEAKKADAKARLEAEKKVNEAKAKVLAEKKAAEEAAKAAANAPAEEEAAPAEEAPATEVAE